MASSSRDTLRLFAMAVARAAAAAQFAKGRWSASTSASRQPAGLAHRGSSCGAHSNVSTGAACAAGYIAVEDQPRKRCDCQPGMHGRHRLIVVLVLVRVQTSGRPPRAVEATPGCAHLPALHYNGRARLLRTHAVHGDDGQHKDCTSAIQTVCTAVRHYSCKRPPTSSHAWTASPPTKPATHPPSP